jgi:hypothetical protein
MNHKGQFDLIEIAVVLLTIAILTILVIYVNSKITDAYKTKVDVNSTAYKAIDKANLTFQNGLDKLFLGIFIILLIGMVILAFYITSSVLFLILFIILAIISTWVSAILSNVYMEVEATGIFASALIHTPIMSYIMENLPIFIAAFAMILLIITYSKDILFQRIGEPQ